jgi:hypothetical protein
MLSRLDRPFASHRLNHDRRQQNYAGLILIFVAIKVGLNLLAMSHFGFQRDELLYLVLGEHLNWGYNEVPPFIALLAKISVTFFGSSLFATRIFSTICSGLIIWFTGQIVVEFGGRRFAIILASLALIFSPTFAASGYLFQPVVFDQLWWLLSVWLLIRYINTSSVKYLYLIGLVTGIGLLTKYSMAFFAIALILALLVSSQRKILWNKHVVGAILVALLLFLPNLAWELAHHFPVVTQMNELRSTQLDYIKPFDFIIQQLIVNGMALFIWLVGLGFLLLSPRLQKFRFLAFAYLFIFLFLLVMCGKNYYLSGAYPMLFAAGGYGIEKWLEAKTWSLRAITAAVLTFPNFIIFPLVLPVFTLDQTMAIFRFDCRTLPFFVFEAKWDDQKIHPLTQNYGDMFGWDEMTEKVANIYYNLSPEQQRHTQIYADNYGEASSISQYGKQYHLPQVVCLNSSFSLWAPPSINADYIIYIDEIGGENVRKLQSSVSGYHKIDEVKNPLAIEQGTAIFLIDHPKRAFNINYQKVLAKRQSE